MDGVTYLHVYAYVYTMNSQLFAQWPVTISIDNQNQMNAARGREKLKVCLIGFAVY